MEIVKRQKRIVGSILRIELGKGYYNYAQILEQGLAFFDIHTKTKDLSDLNILLRTPVLFIIEVYNYIITKGRWLKVGKLPIRDDLKNPPLQYIQDSWTKKFSLYHPLTGEITPATEKQAEGLERASVWDYNHVEDRLRDHYAGRKCEWLDDFWRKEQKEKSVLERSNK